MNTRRIAILVVVIIIYGLFLVGCSPVKKSKTAEVKTIGDIAYDVNRKHGYTAYVEEGSLFVPYLVLTNDYEGNTLLLRRDLLEEPMKFNDYFSYYEDSYIDKYLNKDFKSSFSADILKAMVTTRILITKESSLGNGGEGIKGINREVFLLSCSEIGMSDYSVAGKEGKALKYFPDGDSRIAYVKGKAGSWLLRTPTQVNIRAHME